MILFIIFIFYGGGLEIFLGKGFLLDILLKFIVKFFNILLGFSELSL